MFERNLSSHSFQPADCHRPQMLMTRLYNDLLVTCELKIICVYINIYICDYVCMLPRRELATVSEENNPVTTCGMCVLYTYM